MKRILMLLNAGAWTALVAWAAGQPNCSHKHTYIGEWVAEVNLGVILGCTVLMAIITLWETFDE